MSKLDLENSLFHAIRPYYLSKSKYVSHFDLTSKRLESILKSGVILSREHLKTTLTPKEYNDLTDARQNVWQPENVVSLCCHRHNFDIMDEYYSSFSEGGTTAYLNFIQNPNSLTLIFMIDLIDYLPRSFNSPNRMVDEFQILDQVPLTYLKGLGLWIPLFRENSSEQTRRIIELKEKDVRKEIKTEIKETYRRIRTIKELLLNNNYDLPIVNICTGESFKEEEEQTSILAKRMNF